MTKITDFVRRHFFKMPGFWRDRNARFGRVLKPLSRLYGRIVTWRAAKPARFTAEIPVICVGNFTLGGSGKTPTVQLIAEILKACGKQPAILLRGYGGSAPGPLRVDMTQHSAKLVGDEALLHIHIAPTWVSRDRAAGAEAIQAAGGFDCILLDDGAQNPALHKDLIINVIDGGVGIGNSQVFPAGPLREEFDQALSRTDAIVIVGDDDTAMANRLKMNPAFMRKPIFTAHVTAAENLDHFAEQKLFAFAGIGRPDKFYATLRQYDLDIVETRSFPDHHPYRGSEIKHLSEAADALDARLITTTKDWVRIPTGYQHLVEFLPVHLQLDQIDDLTQLLLTLWR